MSVQALSHAQKVTRLYRKHLKNMLSWTVERDVWRQDACELRGIFDEHKNTDMGTAVKLLEEGEKLYHRHKHPAPYIRECSRVNIPVLEEVEFEASLV